MFTQNSRYQGILGLILIVLGVLTLAIALGDFILRLAIGAFAVYLIYTGLRLRNQHSKVFFFFNNKFGNRFRPF